MKGRNVVIKQKRKFIKTQCQNCRKEMVIEVPHKGDVLCGECMKPSSWTLRSEKEYGEAMMPEKGR